MKISGIRSSIVALPADEPLAGAAENPNGKRPIVTLEVQTDDGEVGVGATYFGGALTGTLKSAWVARTPSTIPPTSQWNG
jgi:L-alanine-DL-glutamate epimerase-like enolase superfamily enzyme